jgi:hypothetical protein
LLLARSEAAKDAELLVLRQELATFEFGGSVVAGEVGGKVAEDGEFADRQAVRSAGLT